MDKKTIVLASQNQGKVREMAEPFKERGYTLISLDMLDEKLELPEETGKSFEENALIKARYIAEKTNTIAIADDSGVEVFSLENAPGIYSARYASMRNDKEILEQNIPTDSKNILQALKDLEKFENPADRKARFVCCLALVFPDEREDIISFGYWDGVITQECLGENGFGYDPIFFDENLQKTAAQLTKEEKMALSHRAKAIKNLLAQCDLVF